MASKTLNWSLQRTPNALSCTNNYEQFEAARKELLSEIERLPIDVNLWIEECKERFKIGLAKKSLTLLSNITVNTIVKADKKLLDRLMDNLMENAIRHSPSNARIAGFM